MVLLDNRWLAFFVMGVLAAACSSQPTPISPSPPFRSSPSPPSPPSPIDLGFICGPFGPVNCPVRSPMQFEMTGAVTDEEGTPLADAGVSVWRDYEPFSTARTDQSGRYKLIFTGVPGANTGPPGTEDSVGFAVADAAGYEHHARDILGTTPNLVENIRLRLIRRIAAGESVALTVAPDDTICALDGLPGRYLICRTVHVAVQNDGIMTIEAVPTQPGSAPVLTVYGARSGAPRANPTSLRVVAGAEYTVHIEFPRGASRSFVVKTSRRY